MPKLVLGLSKIKKLLELQQSLPLVDEKQVLGEYIFKS